jgi:hypothetical protein
MKKLALLSALLFISNFGKAQADFFKDSSFPKSFNKFEIVEPEVGFPNHIIENESEFKHLRDSIHRTGYSYKFISFDSLGEVLESEIFKNSFFPLSVGKNMEEQFSLVNKEGRIIKMVYLDPKI